METQQSIQEDEIDIRKYIEVIIKRRKLVLTIFLISVIVASIVNLLMPKVYEVSMIVQPPTMAYTDTGVQNLDSVENIQAKINAGIYSGRIIKDLMRNNSYKGRSVAFKILQPKDTSLIRISLEEQENKTDLGVAVLNKLLKSIRYDYLGIIEIKHYEIDQKIALIKNQVNVKENEIALRKEQSLMQAETEAKLLDVMREIKPNSDRLNLAISIQLQDELNNLRFERENAEEKTEDLSNDIYYLRNEIEKENILKKEIQNVILIQGPEVSLDAIKPNKKKNIIVAGVFGLLLGLFLAFFMEFVQKIIPVKT